MSLGAISLVGCKKVQHFAAGVCLIPQLRVVWKELRRGINGSQKKKGFRTMPCRTPEWALLHVLFTCDHQGSGRSPALFARATRGIPIQACYVELVSEAL